MFCLGLDCFFIRRDGGFYINTRLPFGSLKFVPVGFIASKSALPDFFADKKLLMENKPDGI